MHVSRLRVAGVILASICVLSVSMFGESDQSAAERAFGQQWKRAAQRAGMIFAGTVLRSSDSPRTDSGVPAVRLRFRVDRGIAGVKSGQTLAIQEWVGALANQSPIREGERIFLFLYPPSRLGLTSPVGGRLGQIRLDASGRFVIAAQRADLEGSGERSNSARLTSVRGAAPGGATARRLVSLDQLERAIRSVRGE